MATQKLTAESILPFITSVLGEKFSRKSRSLSPAVVVTTLIHMAALTTKGYRDSLEELKELIGDSLGWNKTPTASAFCQARRKLSFEDCKQVFWAAWNACPHIRDAAAHKFYHWNLHAVDMTTVNLPVSEELEKDFGIPASVGDKQRVPKCMLTMVMDVGRNMPTGWMMEGYRGSERQAAKEICEYLTEGDLPIGDRGYPSRKFFGQLIDQGADFLLRLPTGKRGAFKEVQAFKASKSADKLITLQRDKKDPNQEPMKIRLIKHALPRNETAVFATTITDNVDITIEELTNLYCSRWRIETAFREMKMWHGLENLRAKNTLGIYQEITALMIFMVLNAELEQRMYVEYGEEIEAAKQQETGDNSIHLTEKSIRFNRKQMAQWTARIMRHGIRGPNEVRKKVEEGLQEIWRYRQRPKRGRTFKRQSRNPDGKWS